MSTICHTEGASDDRPRLERDLLAMVRKPSHTVTKSLSAPKGGESESGPVRSGSRRNWQPPRAIVDGDSERRGTRSNMIAAPDEGTRKPSGPQLGDAALGQTSRAVIESHASLYAACKLLVRAISPDDNDKGLEHYFREPIRLAREAIAEFDALTDTQRPASSPGDNHG